MGVRACSVYLQGGNLLPDRQDKGRLLCEFSPPFGRANFLLRSGSPVSAQYSLSYDERLLWPERVPFYLRAFLLAAQLAIQRRSFADGYALRFNRIRDVTHQIDMQQAIGKSRAGNCHIFRQREA